RAEAEAERPLIAGVDHRPWPVDREPDPRPVADLRHLTDQDAVVGQRLSDRHAEARLRLDAVRPLCRLRLEGEQLLAPRGPAAVVALDLVVDPVQRGLRVGLDRNRGLYDPAELLRIDV